MPSTTNEEHVNGTGDGLELFVKNTLNPAAEPFVLPFKRSEMSWGPQGDSKNPRNVDQLQEIAYIGPTYLPVNKRVWNSISSYSLEDIARTRPPARPAQRQFANICSNNRQTPTTCFRSLSRHHVSCATSRLSFGPFLLSSGIIRLLLRDSMIVDITLDGSVKVINGKKNIAISISSNTMAIAMNHPNGVILQNGQRVDIAAYDGKRQNNFIRYAKMWDNGISLASEGCALIFLVDSAGTRTTSDKITMDLHSDYVNQVFFNGVVCATQNMTELHQVLQSSSFQLSHDGSLVFHINDFRITQGSDGLVKIFHSNKQCSIHTSPTNGSATVKTPNIHCTASLGATSHLFARIEERRMHFDGSVFIVRNAGHSAGFDECNRLRVY